MEKVTFTILRYDPENGKKPYYQDFEVKMERPGMMILDGLNQIRWEQDGTLAYRRSCREGVCGSDGVNVNGVNMLTCVTHISDVVKKGKLVIQPLPGMPLIKDLVVDLDDFLQKYFTVKPYLITKSPAAGARTPAIAGGAQKARRPVRVHPLRLLLQFVPLLLGPSGLHGP